MLKNLPYYMHKFAHLRCNRNASLGTAPHKPVMLLSIAQGFQNGSLASNHITLTADLVQLFRTTWNQIVSTPHSRNFLYPFFHLISEGFWTLIPKFGTEKALQNAHWMTSSLHNVEAALAYVAIDEELALLLQDPTSNQLLQETLLNTYFATTKHLYRPLENSLQNGIAELATPTIPKTSPDVEEEVFIRGGLFKKIIPQIYNNTCAISKSRFTSTISNLSMVDACHIVPFSESHDDNVTNGIALCPNLHRAFDRGLIAISDDYTVLVSPGLIEDKSSPYNLSQFKGQSIALPFAEELYPSLSNLATHRKRFGY